MTPFEIDLHLERSIGTAGALSASDLLADALRDINGPSPHILHPNKALRFQDRALNRLAPVFAVARCLSIARHNADTPTNEATAELAAFVQAVKGILEQLTCHLVTGDGHQQVGLIGTAAELIRVELHYRFAEPAHAVAYAR
ncbi:hypothetical protein [Azospirillum argentinense]|uniref:Uncharacterized protein n=1 Tax=Azospirillum argentinense TaxID=2970906 RepID=A0A5B0KM99_9PROT|nr:hypothetical protein [Azospirillum argentinense]KAA1052953.1 hypothetical protein FH063_003360 [Azospirillum argentinense]